MKINVHAGHNSIVTGASKYLNEVKEDRKVKDYLISYLKDAGHTVYDCTDDVGKSKYDNLGNIVKKCNAHKVDLDVSIHLNAGGGTGVETWNYDTRTKAYSDRINNKVSKALGIRNRGTKYSKELYVLRNTNSLALLVECCFVDSKVDKNAWNAKKCAKAIAEGILNKSISETANKPSASKPSTSKPKETGYYKKCSAKKLSLVDGLKEIGVNSSFGYRKKIAKANGITVYLGTAKQNVKLLTLLKNGKLKKV